ncbi:hypothetical protein TNCV_4776611 [Trichonephila clavipes]|nr:hypothetical protein TNCV_4776611 [Trichonephila clavipes]
MECHCLRYTVTPNIDPWHNDVHAKSMASFSLMCFQSRQGSQEPFFNKTMLGYKQQGYYKTATATHLWPTKFPDLSPIEHFWDPLGWQIKQPVSFVELETRLQQLWNLRDVVDSPNFETQSSGEDNLKPSAPGWALRRSRLTYGPPRQFGVTV